MFALKMVNIILFINICSIPFSFQLFSQLTLPIPSESSNQLVWYPWDSDQLYISNLKTHFLFDIDSQTTVKIFTSGPEVAGGSLYPVVFSSPNQGIIVSYINNSNIYFKKEKQSDQSSKLKQNDFFNIAYYDTTQVIFGEYDSPKIRVVWFDSATNSEVKSKGLSQVNIIYVYVLKKKQILIISTNTSGSEFSARFWTISDNGTKETKINQDYDDGVGSFHLVEGRNNLWYGCFLDEDYEKVSCFSAVYGSESFEIITKTKTVIRNCASQHPNNVISLAPFREKYAIAACGGSNFKLKIINENIEAMSEEINFKEDNFTFYDFTVLSNDKIVIAGIYYKNSNYLYHAYVFEFDKCPDTTEVFLLINEDLLFSNYFKYSDSVIVFTSAVPSSSFQYSLDEDYANTSVIFNSVNSVDVEIKFNIYNRDILGNKAVSDGQCEWKIHICFSSCNSCDISGTNTSHNCKECLQDFLPIENNSSNCYNEETKPENSILNPENSMYLYCHESCLKCETTINNCVTCADGYAMVFDNVGTCRWHNDPPERHYWTTDKTYFKLCYDSCASCWVEGFENQNNCESCINSFYPAENLLKMCYNSKPNNNYFFNSSSNMYSLCNTRCSECVDNANKCWSCKDEYYWFNNTCYTLVEKPSNTYVNEGDKIFELCYERCATCSIGHDLDNNNCNTCWSGFYFWENTNCVTTVPDNYYEDTLNNVYRKCDTKCTKCTGSANNCLECSDGFFFLSSQFRCLTLEEKPSDHYITPDNKSFEQCFSTCNTCRIGGTNQNNNCDSCKTDLSFIEGMEKNCFSSPPDTNYYLDANDNTYKTCYMSCKECNTSGDINIHNCLSCIDGYEFVTAVNCRDSSLSELYSCNDLTVSVVDHTEYWLNFEELDTYIIPNISSDTNAYLRFTTSSTFPLNGRIQSIDTNSDITLNAPLNTRLFKYIPNNVKDISSISYTVVDDLNFSSSSSCTLTFITCDTNCKECSNTNFCTSCLDNHYILKENINSVDMKCVQECGDYYFYPALNACFDKCPEYTYQKECVDQCPDNTESNEDDHCITKSITPCSSGPNCFESTESKEETIKNLDDNILSYKDINSTIVGEDYMLEVTYSNSSHNNPNTSSINLGECEIILKAYYKIPLNEPLLIAKIDVISNNSITNKVEYSVYDIRGQKLDLKYCKNIQIEIEYPITDSDNLDIDSAKDYADWGVDVFNSSDNFFNDICNPHNIDGKDIVISDRRNEVYQNVSFCEENCEYDGIDFETMKVKCLCSVKEEINVEDEEKPVTNSNAFTNSISSINFAVAKCYKLLFDWNNWKNNYGFWFTSVIIGVQLIILICFQYVNYCSFFTKLNQNCQKTFLAAQTTNGIPKCSPVHRTKMYSSETKKNNQSTTTIIKPRKIFSGSTVSTRIHRPVRKASGLKLNQTNKSRNQYTVSTESSLSPNKFNSTSKFKPVQIPDTTLQKTNESQCNEIDLSHRTAIMEYWKTKKEKVDNLPYEIAEKEDKRRFSKIFWELFREKEVIWNTFFPIELFEMVSINICYFWFNIALSFVINALFYTDDIISARYHNELSFISNLLQTIYSCAISFILSKVFFSLISYCSWLETLFKEVYEMEKWYFFINRAWKRLKRKIFVFYTFILLLGGLFCYYLTLFCIVYQGSQYEWFKNGWISFLLDFTMSWGICVAWSLIRSCALAFKNKGAYNVSNYLKQWV